jgi:hypothetical protein
MVPPVPSLIEPQPFVVQEGRPEQWRLVVDTHRASPDDVCDPGCERPLATMRCIVAPRSIGVLVRPRPDPASIGASQ